MARWYLGRTGELFAAIAATAGALTGLLFVAISVAPRRGPVSGLPVIQQVRAAAALLAFTNALAVSLFGLVPGTNVGYPATVLGVIGILFTAAGMRSILTSTATLHRQRWGQLGLFALLLLIFGMELACGIAVIAGPRRGEPVQLIGYALVTSLLVGIARAWELVGGVDTGIIASLVVLTGRAPGPRGRPALRLLGPSALLRLATPPDPNLMLVKQANAASEQPGCWLCRWPGGVGYGAVRADSGPSLATILQESRSTIN